jgi:23S rRNA (pseudouridine1915-N3)-methyltransferase
VKVVVACVGRLKEKYLQAAEAEYQKRLRSYCKLEIKELKSDAALAESIPDKACLVVLDERGKTPSSVELANQIIGHERLHGGGRPIYFAIGGADGHSETLRKRANHVISFGRLTIAHRLVRVLVLEQIYRAFTILAGEPYHRE